MSALDAAGYGLSLIVGLVVGSFLNVLIYRVPRGESILFPPSHCTNCGSSIRTRDNIPVLSYALLRGRCHSCGARIPMQYPLVELLTAALFFALYWRYGPQPRLIPAALFLSVLVVVSGVDLAERIIPNRIIFPAVGLAAALLVPGFLGVADFLPLVGRPSAVYSILGFGGGGAFLFLIALLAPFFAKKEAMGAGDVKLAFLMGLNLGGYVFLGLFVGFLLGAVAGIFLLVSGRTKWGGMIPFGPFLALGAVITVFFGPAIWSSYLRASGL